MDTTEPYILTCPDIDDRDHDADCPLCTGSYLVEIPEADYPAFCERYGCSDEDLYS